ncbi:MAG: DNA polymerase III subunit beta [bacterium]
MKFICTKENLTKALNTVAKSVGHDVNLPVLANVLLKAEDSRLKLAATNLEIGITCYVGGKVDKEGDITVPARLLTDYVATLPDDKVTMEVSESILRLSASHFAADIKGIEASEFPLIPEVRGEPICSLPARELKRALSQVVFAAALDESRPELSGVFIKFEDNKMVLAATDGYRLAEKTVKLAATTKEETDMIVPARTIQEIIRILPDSDEITSLTVSENQIKVEVAEITIISRLVDGKYPDYKGIIPAEFISRTKLQAPDLANSLKASSLFAQSGIYDVHMLIDAEDGKLKLSSESAQVGSNISDVPIEVEGKPSEATFNYRYVLDGLNSLGTKEAVLELNSDSGPGVLRPTENDDYIYIIMPIKQ